METTRRSKSEFGFVKLPFLDDERYQNSGEGGVEFWIIANKPKEYRRKEGHVRQVCITGFEIGVIASDVVCNGEVSSQVDNAHRAKKLGDEITPIGIDGAVCIGSSGISLYDEHLGRYWIPTLKDLDRIGQTMFHAFEELYGAENVEIVTVLDT